MFFATIACFKIYATANILRPCTENKDNDIY